MKKTLSICLILLSTSFTAFVSAQEGREKAESLLKESVTLADGGNIDKSLEAAQEAVKADPGFPDAYDHLGNLLLKKGQFDEAISSFNSALKINPGMRTSKTGIGIALLKKGDLKGAETTLKDALVLSPSPSMTHYALGLVYENQGDYKKAVEHYKEGLKTYKVRAGKE